MNQLKIYLKWSIMILIQRLILSKNNKILNSFKKKNSKEKNIKTNFMNKKKENLPLSILQMHNIKISNIRTFKNFKTRKVMKNHIGQTLLKLYIKYSIMIKNILMIL